MIVVRLWGGLGNQMFQYACGYAVAKRNNQVLKLDTRFFSEEYIKKNPHFSKQQLNILKFPIEYTETINTKGEFKFISFIQNRTISRLIRIPKRFKLWCDHGLLYIKETRLQYLPFINSLKYKNLYLDGYWQTEKYFKEFREDLKQQFSLLSVEASSYVEKVGINKENSISIHMRMGDYSVNKKKIRHYNYVISPQYYLNAIDYVRQKVENPVFYICSNNIERAKELLGNSESFIYVNENRAMSDIDEFMIMSMCTNHIISNSTFSWWAAWLSQKEGITIAPDMFFGNANIIPDEWKKICVE